MILVTIGLLIVAIGISIYLGTRKTKSLSVIEQLPSPGPHEHVAPDGTVIEHQHAYKELTEKAAELAPKTPLAKQEPWNRIDLAAVRRDYQKYTVPEMRGMWDSKFKSMYGPFGNSPPKPILAEADRVYPRDEWLARMLDYGLPFVNQWDYKFALGPLRHKLVRLRTEWDSDPVKFLQDIDFPLDMSWEEYEEIVIKGAVVYKNNYWRAKDADPDSFVGGWTADNGVFIPFQQNTVHVHFSPETTVARFSGVQLTRLQKDDLKMYGIAPKGLNVVYLDKNNQPLPPGTPPPRLYERRMKELEEARAFIQQQIEYHETMFELGSLLDLPEEAKQTVPVPHDHVHDHDHTHEASQAPETLPSQQRQQPDAKQTPPQRKLPPELRTSDAVSRWFTELEALHGGQLPKDLKELRKIITELEKIRREGEAKLKPPQRPEHPAPDTAPPEGGSDAPPDKED